MKKFTSLFFALAVMLSVNAALPKEIAEARKNAAKIELVSPFTSHVVRSKAGKADAAIRMSDTQFVVRKAAAKALEEVTIDIETPMSYKYSSYIGDWEITASNDDYSVALDIINNDGTSLAGSYTEANLYGSNGPSARYNNVTDKATGTSYGVTTATIDVTDDGSNIDIDAHLVCEGGLQFHVIMFYARPVAESFETINANMFMLEEGESFMGYTFYTTTISGANEDYAFSFEYDDAINTLVDGDTLYIGTDLDGSITPNGEDEAEAYSGYLVVTALNGQYRLRGEVLCLNNVQYTLDLIYVLPEATRTATLTANVALYNAIADYGVFQMYGYNADSSKYVSVAIYASQIAGTYALADLYKEYAYVIELGADTVDLSPITANLTVAEAGNGDVTLSGTMRMMNSADPTDVVDYTLNLTYVKPVATRTINVTAAATFYDYASESGDWYVYGNSADKSQLVALDFYYPSTGEVAGSYSKSDVYSRYTYVALVNGTDTVAYEYVDGSFTVVVDANNNATLTGTYTGQNYNDLNDVVDFNLTVTFEVAKSSSSAMQYDADAGFSRGFAEYNVLTQYIAQYGVVLVTAEDESAGVVLQFNVGTSATGLTAGTYPIASTDAVGTMHQCTGYDAQYGPDYSHAYTYSGDSYTNLWYMVSGQAVVTDNSIVVSALNSLGHHINVTLGAGSAVENVDANAAVEKFVRNGQVIIRRGNKEYNTLGAEL
ncbi:MAG: hypothetical protein IJS13_03390 [Paludibacteraceae bacterium]|nr:hypothetical protein [Paludibacteraceae bacterium]